ncbi:MAG: hypothetical protein ACT4QG_01280 [Sporichthyaceae bacterium]
MPTSLEALERRVVILEARMHANDLEHLSLHATLNTLSGGQEALLGMLRDQGHLLKTHETRLDGIDRRLEGIDTRLDGIDTRLDGIDTRLDGIDRRLDGIDTKLEQQGGKLDIVLAWIATQP